MQRAPLIGLIALAITLGIQATALADVALVKKHSRGRSTVATRPATVRLIFN